MWHLITRDSVFFLSPSVDKRIYNLMIKLSFFSSLLINMSLVVLINTGVLLHAEKNGTLL